MGTESPARPNSMIVKVGTMDDPSAFSAQAAIFTCDIQPFHHLPDGLPAFEKRPPKINNFVSDLIVPKKDKIVNLKTLITNSKEIQSIFFTGVYGLFFAFFITSPDDWHSPLILVMAAMGSGLVAFILLKFKNK